MKKFACLMFVCLMFGGCATTKVWSLDKNGKPVETTTTKMDFWTSDNLTNYYSTIGKVADYCQKTTAARISAIAGARVGVTYQTKTEETLDRLLERYQIADVRCDMNPAAIKAPETAIDYFKTVNGLGWGQLALQGYQLYQNRYGNNGNGGIGLDHSKVGGDVNYFLGSNGNSFDKSNQTLRDGSTGYFYKPFSPNFGKNSTQISGAPDMSQKPDNSVSTSETTTP